LAGEICAVKNKKNKKKKDERKKRETRRSGIRFSRRGREGGELTRVRGAEETQEILLPLPLPGIWTGGGGVRGTHPKDPKLNLQRMPGPV